MRNSGGTPSTGLGRALVWLDLSLMTIAAIAMGLIMLVVTLDATLRYTLSAPLIWSYDLIGLYLMVAVFFLALSDTLNHHGHIAVDLFQNLIPFRTRHFFLGIGYALSTWVMVLIASGAVGRFYTALVRDERIAATIPWPTSIAYLLVTVGSAALVVRCLVRVYGHFASAFTGRLMVSMPPPPQEGIEEI